MKPSPQNRSVDIALFFIAPLLISKAAFELEVPDFGAFYGWKDFYEVALNAKNQYAMALTLYLAASPLAVSWIHSISSFQGTSRMQALVLSMGCALISIALFWISLRGPPVSSIESPTKGIRLIVIAGKSHATFCLMYGAFVLSFVATGYASALIFYHLIMDILKGIRSEQ